MEVKVNDSSVQIIQHVRHNAAPADPNNGQNGANENKSMQNAEDGNNPGQQINLVVVNINNT
eukprot:CAMPEP_0185594542 /NCGR_PEP_ID=MMETSP0434-20130131/75340_1 /TAXON_ID=626734 ORGANISM="Favella taraikaensis, Strain Fe Narragansett Bay" /NCGR_SAMPLE_ID=MMETSP0434 /ASSEMBLY_ACC=CAM_ASM_000379 /LENGTH=61 /DNA_ID=CAMNT_0028221969 /DNA_START=111 /DNA_END=292 /DNA_ORIENTATION=-